MPPEERARPLPELPAEQTVFIDANILIYHFAGLSPECSGFLERCKRGELWGATTVHILLEVLHRLMMIEAVAKGLVTLGNVAKKLGVLNLATADPDFTRVEELQLFCPQDLTER